MPTGSIPIAPLYTFGFADTLGHLTVVRSVSDAQMFAANAGWYQALPKELQMAFDTAAERTQQESFAQIEKARAVSIAEFKKAGAQFYAINASEYKQWVDACGEPRKEWEEFKVKFAGSVANFEKLKGRRTPGSQNGRRIHRELRAKTALPNKTCLPCRCGALARSAAAIPAHEKFLKPSTKNADRWAMLIFYTSSASSSCRRSCVVCAHLLLCVAEEVARYGVHYLC